MFIRFNVRNVRQKGSEALPSKGPLKTENLSGTFKVLFNLPLLLMIFLSFVLCSFFSSPAAPVQRLIRGQIDSNKRKTVPSEGPFLPNGCHFAAICTTSQIPKISAASFLTLRGR